MADFDNRIVRGATTVADTMDTGLRAHMLRVYNWMASGPLLTGVVAYGIFASDSLRGMFYVRDAFTGFLHPSADASGTGFQANQAKISIGSGQARRNTASNPSIRPLMLWISGRNG